MIRVYHPVLNAWQDVWKKDVVKWQRQGWVTEKPAHVDDSDALPVDAETEGNLETEPAPARAKRATRKATARKATARKTAATAADTAPAATTVTAK